MASLIELPEAHALRSLSRDGRLLFATRVVRMFAFGLLSVVLVLYLAGQGLAETQVGLLLTWTLVGDAILSLAITLVADRQLPSMMPAVKWGTLAELCSDKQHLR